MTQRHAELRLRRTGGLAGLPMEATLHTADLDAAQAAALHEALDAVAAAPPTPPAPGSGPPDTFHYRLEVHRDDDVQTLEFGEREVPEPLAPVVSALRERLAPAKRRSS